MIFARRTNECSILRERVSASNCSRSCSANTTAALGLPIAHPPFPRLHEASELIKLIMGQNRSSNGLFYGTEQIFKDLQIIFAGQDTRALTGRGPLAASKEGVPGPAEMRHAAGTFG